MASATDHGFSRGGASGRWCLPFVAAVLVYLGTFVLLPWGGFWICDNGAKFIQVQSLVRAEYRDYSIPWPGARIDPTLAWSPLPEPFGQVIDNRLYCMYSPAFALLVSPLFRVCGPAGLYVLPLVGGLLVLPAVWLLAGLFSAPRTAQPLAVLLVALTTPVWFYSVTFWEHTPAACLMVWSVCLCARHVLRHGSWNVPLAAVGCGLAVYFRDESYLLVPVLAGILLWYGPRRGRAVAVFLVIVLATLLPLWLFQWRALGHPLGWHFAPHNPFSGGLVAYVAGRWPAVRALLLSASDIDWLSVTVVLPALILWAVYPRVTERIFRWLVVVVAALALASGLVILGGHLTADSPMRYLRFSNGLLAVSPIVWLAFVRVWPGSDRSVEPPGAQPERVLWLIVSAYTLLYVLTAPARIWGGVHWGCRFLLGLYPLLGVLAAVALVRWWHAHAATARGQRTVLVATLALSLLLQVYSLRLLRDRMAFTRTLNQAVAACPEDVVVTDTWYLPMDLAQCFYDKTIFLARTPSDFLHLTEALCQAGTEEILFVRLVDPPRAGTPAGLVLHDGSLRFSSVELVRVPLLP